MMVAMRMADTGTRDADADAVEECPAEGPCTDTARDRSVAARPRDAVSESPSGAAPPVVREVSAQDWDAFVLRFEDAIQEQLQDFNAARRSDDKLRRLGVFRGDTPVGAALLRKVRVPVTGGAIYSTRWGPLWRPAGADPAPDDPEAVYRALVDTVVRDEGAGLVFMPRPDPAFGEADLAALDRLGFRAAPPLHNAARYFVNVDLAPDAIRKSLSQKWRYNLKKALREGLETGLVHGEEGRAEVLALYEEMVARKKFVDYSPIDTLARRLAHPLDALRPRMFVTRKDGRAVAMAVVDVCGDTASFLYGATSDAALPLRAGYALQWAVLEYLSAQPSIRWYGLGGGGDTENCSLHQFKRGMTGKAGRTVPEPSPRYIGGRKCPTALVRVAVSSRDMRNRLREGLGAAFSLRLGG